MKNNLLFLTIFLFIFSPNVHSQIYQHVNGDCETWDGSGENIEPHGWNSFMTAEVTISIGGSLAQNQQVDKSTDIRPGSTGQYSIKIWARSVLGIIANGAVTAGRMHMGSMTATSSQNYNITTRSNPDFCHPFNGKPDSLVFWAKSNCSGHARINAIIHDDYDYRDPQTSDANAGSHVVGNTATSDGAFILLPPNANTWTRYSVPFIYDGYPATIPKYIMMNATTNNVGGQGSGNDVLYVDDFQFIYNCIAADIKLNGERIEGFNPSIESYSIERPCGTPLNVTAIATSVGAVVTVDQATEANNHTATITITNGDNSKTITINFTLTNEDINIADNICQGQNYTQNGFNLDVYNNPGTYNESISVPTGDGCSQVTNLSLSVYPQYNITNDVQICSGQSYDFFGTQLTEEGSYQHILTTDKGCDSTINLNLAVGDSYIFNFNASICEGETYTENGFNTSESGFHSYSITSGSGCDSVFNLNLTINETYENTFNVSICDGSAYDFEGTLITEAGTYSKTFSSSLSCDSTVHVNVTVNDVIENVINETITRQQRYTDNGFDIFDTDTVGTFTFERFDSTNCEKTILNLTIRDNERPPLETSSDFVFSVFPNPAKTYLTVEIEQYEANDITYVIFDNIGNIVLKGTIYGDSYDINTSSLRGGVYTLRLILSEEYSKSTKFIIR